MFDISQTPDLAPLNYHMFGSLKESLRGQRFASDDKVKEAVHTCLRSEPSTSFTDRIRRLVIRYTICVEKRDDCVEELYAFHSSHIVLQEAVNKFTLVFDSSS